MVKLKRAFKSTSLQYAKKLDFNVISIAPIANEKVM